MRNTEALMNLQVVAKLRVQDYSHLGFEISMEAIINYTAREWVHAGAKRGMEVGGGGGGGGQTAQYFQTFYFNMTLH